MGKEIRKPARPGLKHTVKGISINSGSFKPLLKPEYRNPGNTPAVLYCRSRQESLFPRTLKDRNIPGSRPDLPFTGKIQSFPCYIN